MQFSLCVHLLDLLESAFCNNEFVAVEDVINIDGVYQRGLDTRDVGCALDQFLIYLWHNDKRFLIGAEFGKHLHNGLGLVILNRDVVYNNQVVVGNLGGKCGFQCQSLNFLWQGVAVVSWLRTQRDTAVCPLWSSGGALSCTACTLLLPWFAAAAGNLGAGQGDWVPWRWLAR